jgi:hypothetical protein
MEAVYKVYLVFEFVAINEEIFELELRSCCTEADNKHANAMRGKRGLQIKNYGHGDFESLRLYPICLIRPIRDLY